MAHDWSTNLAMHTLKAWYKHTENTHMQYIYTLVLYNN
jgi:hypothetical protein